jgi:hypothetical protein
MKRHCCFALRELVALSFVGLAACGSPTRETTSTTTTSSVPPTTTTTSSTTTTTTSTTTTTTAPLCSYVLNSPSRPLDLPNNQNSSEAQADTAQWRPSVSTSSGCAWTASSNQPWLRITNPAGAGSASINLNWDTTTADRVAKITVAGQTLDVMQHAANWNGFP